MLETETTGGLHDDVEDPLAFIEGAGSQCSRSDMKCHRCIAPGRQAGFLPTLGFEDVPAPECTGRCFNFGFRPPARHLDLQIKIMVDSGLHAARQDPFFVTGAE